MGAARVFGSAFSVALMRPPRLTIILPTLFTFLTSSRGPLPIPTSIGLLLCSMEIDFMGLYSQSTPPPGPPPGGYDPHALLDSGIVSLSLCTSSPTDESAVFQDFLRKKVRKSPAESMTSAQPREQSCQSFVGKPVIGHSGFRYDREEGLPISRKKFERPLSFPASSTVSIYFPAQKAADRRMYATRAASFDYTRKSKDGYTPTVAMARKATLARFLEKRSHRLNQHITVPHVMGRSLNWPEACDTTFTTCNKKIKSSMEHEVLM